MLVDKQVIYVDKVESSHAIRMYSRIGKVAPLFCTGVGKAVLAFQSPEMIKEMLDGLAFRKYTQSTIVSREKLLRELASIRKNGYALDREEHEADVACLAVPLRDYTRKVIASVSITAILFQISMEKLLEYRGLLLEKGRQISENLGYRDLARVQGPAPSTPRGRGRNSFTKRVFKSIS
jgi:DNA-binding IclR family transcriptional regulator